MIQIFSKAGLLGRLISKCKINNSSLHSTHPPAISLKYILKEVVALHCKPAVRLECQGTRWKILLQINTLSSSKLTFLFLQIQILSFHMTYSICLTPWYTLSSNKVQLLRPWHPEFILFAVLLLSYVQEGHRKT